MDFKSQIDINNIPKHVAVIMDGNGRWAKEKGKDRVFGHSNGVESVRNTLKAAAEIGVSYLTLYAFSTENWNRPANEVDALMNLLVHVIYNEVDELNKNNVKLNAIGNLEALPKECLSALNHAIKVTKNNTGITLILALSYSSKWEITRAVQQIANQIVEGNLLPENITEDTINQFLCTKNIPEPELLIRTSGETRASNFLLWQIAYSEFYFTHTHWPDFNQNEFYKAILNYQNRERRFGKISEQIAH